MKKYFALAIICFASLITLFLPIFCIDELIVTGNNFVTEKQISDLINFNTGENIFLFNKFVVQKKLRTNYFINTAKINYLLPNKISVNIVERVPICYVKYLNDSYILIDNEARIIEISKVCDKNFPIVLGLNFDSFTLGQILNIDDKFLIDSALQLSKFVLENDFMQNNLVIDFSDRNNICLYVKDIDIHFGDMNDAPQKIALIKSILESGSDYLNKPGILYLNHKNLAPVFKFIT